MHRSAFAGSVLVVIALFTTAPAHAVQRRAFATSVTGAGNISTWPGATGSSALDKADAVCRARAAAGGLPNAATYRAWISTGTTDAYCHVQGLAGQKFDGCDGAALPGGGPWYLRNGITTFTAGLEELVNPPYAIYRPVIFDEFGNEIVEGRLLTGTLMSGLGAGGQTCLDWTSSSAGQTLHMGNTSASAVQWTGNAIVSCDLEFHLLCLEPGVGDGSPPAWAPGVLAFVSSAEGNGNLSSWPEAEGSTGLDAGDRICRNLAAAAALPAPGSFVAWLGANPVDASDRLTTDGPFRRVDGVPIAFSFDDLRDGIAANSLHVDERGDYLITPGKSWTGASALGLWVPESCAGWTSASPGLLGQEGWGNRARTGSWTEAFDVPCDLEKRLYCFSNVVTLFWDGFELTGDASRWSSAAGFAP